MLSLLQPRLQLPFCSAWVALSLIVLGLRPGVAQAQSAMAVEPLEPTARVVGFGSGSPFDLADLGPDFSASWLTAALPALTDAGQTPVLMQRTQTDRGSGTETRTMYDRASDGRLLVQRTEQRQGTSWTPAQRTVYEYQQGALTMQRTDRWSRGAWEPDQRIKLQHGDDGTVHTVVHQTRRAAQWINEARLTRQVIEQPPVDSAEAPAIRRQLIRSTWIDGAWDRTARITFTVAEEDRLIMQQNETWTGARWAHSVQVTYMYDGGGYPIERSLAVWIGDSWSEGPLHLYDYAVHGERVERRTETWVGARHVRTLQATLTYAEPVQTPLLGSASLD